MTYGVAVIIDSFENVFPFFTLGTEYRFENIITNDLSLSIGANIFAGVKKINDYYTNDITGETTVTDTYYSPLTGLAPSLKIYYKDISINMYVSPSITVSIDNKNYHAEGFVYTTFSYAF